MLKITLSLKLEVEGKKMKERLRKMDELKGREKMKTFSMVSLMAN